MKTLGLSYTDIYWRMPWGLVLRMLADLPYTKYLKEGEKKKTEYQNLTPETSDVFKDFINNVNKK